MALEQQISDALLAKLTSCQSLGSAYATLAAQDPDTPSYLQDYLNTLTTVNLPACLSTLDECETH